MSYNLSWDHFRAESAIHLKKALLQTGLTEADIAIMDFYNLLVEPPDLNMADLAFGCFIASKILKKSPAVVASEVAAKISSPSFSSVKAAGPYVNFIFTNQFYKKNLMDRIADQSFFKQNLTDSKEKMMIEYSQPNTHKELHVGHLRNACLGDSLIRMLKYSGFSVIGSTFPGDVGTHVAKCLWYLKFHNREPVPQTRKGEWIGSIYSKAHLKLEDETGTPQEDRNREQLTLILKQLENQSGEYYDLWKETREWSIELMNQVYNWAGISFDRWYWESEVDAPSVAYVKKLFAEGKLVQSEGAIGYDLTDENLGFCLLLKSDGNGLYATKDLELARKKFQDFNIDKSIYVVDLRQELHFKQVFKVLEKLGFEKAKNCFHLKYNFVELPDGAMSSRKGNIVPLLTLVKNMEVMIKTNYLERYRNEWDPTEIDLTATQVAKGAIRYGMLRQDTAKKIIFDLNEWLKLDGESGPFIQYSVARIHSLLKKFEFNAAELQNVDLLLHPTEHRLLQKMAYFNNNVLMCAQQNKPSSLCTYLYELAKLFNQFYHDCSIGNAETPQLKMARLLLSYDVSAVLTEGLSLLGIPSVQRM